MQADTDAVIDALLKLAEKVAAGEEADIRRELRPVPVPLRVAFAALTLAAADRPLSGKNLAAAGGFSRGSTLRDYGETVAALQNAAPHIVAAQLGDTGSGASVSELAHQLQERDDTIAELREQVAQHQRDLDIALSYARDLHEHVRAEFEANAQERASKVRRLRPEPET